MKSSPVDVQNGTVLEEPLYIHTPKPPTPKAMLGVIKQIADHWEWQGKIGCGFPGVLKGGIVLTAANLDESWVGVNIEREIKELTFCENRVINDADCAGLAEMRFGAGKEYNKHAGGVVLMVTLGTGIGTALFIDGHLVHNTEFGHIELDGVDAETRAATVHMESENLSWAEWAERVNRYLHTMEKLLSPDVFIIGGGVSESANKFFPYLSVKTPVISAKMHNEAGIIGAALAVV